MTIELSNILTVGDTLDFTTSVPDYPAGEGWTLKYRLVPRSAAVSAISITATADGDDYDIQVAASTTATWTAGFYTWSAYVELGSERYTVGRGQLEIRASSSAMAAGFDDRTHARIVLDAIEAVIEGRATLDQQEYTIGNRSLKRMPIDDLMKLRNTYARMVANEEASAAGRPGGPLGRMRYGVPS